MLGRIGDEKRVLEIVKGRKLSLIHISLPAVGAVHVRPPTFNRSPHWATYLKQFEAAACAISWTDKEKVVLLVLALKGSAAVPLDRQNAYADLIKACLLYTSRCV